MGKLFFLWNDLNFKVKYLNIFSSKSCFVWHKMKNINLLLLLQLLLYTISWACPLSISEEKVQSCQRFEGNPYSEWTLSNLTLHRSITHVTVYSQVSYTGCNTHNFLTWTNVVLFYSVFFYLIIFFPVPTHTPFPIIHSTQRICCQRPWLVFLSCLGLSMKEIFF